jgi:hypothetical protein
VRGSRLRLGDIDWIGAGMLIAGLTPLLVALTLTRDHAWLSPQVLGLLLLAALLLAGFGWVERRAAHPVVPFALFRRNVFAVPAVIAFFSAIGMFGTVTFVPLLYQGLLGLNATNSGQLLTPMMLAVVVTATPTGALMTRVPRYRFVGTAAIGTMIAGLLLLSQVGLHTSSWEVARDIVIVGAGLGVTFPLTIAVVQAGLPHALVGVATSQVNFWRSLGGAIGTAILGSILANRLPADVHARVATLPRLPGFSGAGAGGSQALLDPAQLARLRASLPPVLVPTFERFVEASRLALASTLHDLFLMAAAVAAVALVATLFLREVQFSRAESSTDEDVPEAA